MYTEWECWAFGFEWFDFEPRLSFLDNLVDNIWETLSPKDAPVEFSVTLDNYVEFSSTYLRFSRLLWLIPIPVSFAHILIILGLSMSLSNEMTIFP